MSRRTLHRELEAKRPSFQQILKATRERLARHYLKNPALSASQIAFSGETPEQTRSALLHRQLSGQC